MNPFFLLIDDDQDDAELFREAISEIEPSLQVQHFTNAMTAWEKLKTYPQLPDLIFLDVNMPMMNGLDYISKLKSEHSFCKIPVIMYSTSSHQKEINTAIEYGALAFFTKPNSYKELKQILHEIYNHLIQGSLNTISTALLSKARNI